MRKKRIITIDAVSLGLFFGDVIGIGFGRGVEKKVLEMLSTEEREILEASIDSIGKVLMGIAQKNEKFEAWIQDKDTAERDCENCPDKESCGDIKSEFERIMEGLRR